MHLLVFVIPEAEKLGEFLAGLAKLGLRGGTVWESQGMRQVLEERAGSFSVRHLLSRKSYHHTVFSLIEETELLDKTLRAAKEGELPVGGVAFHVPVTQLVRLGMGTVTKPIAGVVMELDRPIAIRGWEIEPHAARWVGFRPGEITVLTETAHRVSDHLLLELDQELVVAGEVNHCEEINGGYRVVLGLSGIEPTQARQVEKLAGEDL